jgi:hypothetical protein
MNAKQSWLNRMTTFLLGQPPVKPHHWLVQLTASFPRKRESRLFLRSFWMPAYAGMTILVALRGLLTSCE